VLSLRIRSSRETLPIIQSSEQRNLKPPEKARVVSLFADGLVHVNEFLSIGSDRWNLANRLVTCPGFMHHCEDPVKACSGAIVKWTST
jgi:hypothetical protein